MRLHLAVVVVLLATPIAAFAQPFELKRGNATVSGDSVTFEFILNDPADLSTYPDSRIYYRRSDKPETDWSSTAGKMTKNIASVTIPLSDFGRADRVHYYLQITQGGAPVFKTPEGSLGIELARTLGDVSTTKANLDKQVAEKEKRIADLEADAKAASEQLAKFVSASPTAVKVGVPAATTPDFAVLGFEILRDANKAAGQILIEVETANGQLNFKSSEMRTDHRVKVNPQRGDRTKPEQFSFTVYALDGAGNQKSKANGKFTLPPDPATRDVAVAIKNVSDDGFTVEVTPKIGAVFNVDVVDKSAGRRTTFGRPLTLDDWQIPLRSLLYEAGKAVTFDIPNLKPGTSYEVVVHSIDELGKSLNQTYSQKTVETFDFHDTITIELSPGSYEIKWSATTPIKEATFLPLGPDLAARKWQPAVIDGVEKKSAVATIPIALLTKLGQPADVQLKMTDELGKPRQRTISIGFKGASPAEIKAKNPQLTPADAQKLYDQVTGKRKIDWGGLVTAGIKLLVAVP